MQTNIIKIIEELFTMSKNDRVELSKLIDKFLIPSISENKKLAEISTPYELRQKMLNEIPEDFWKNPKKVFEPCCGKGGFLIDIIDRFMEGMCDFCKDPKERYRIIVEDCLFFSDINDTNVSISKLLIDQNNIYKLNFNFGDTLQLNVKDKWDILEFDAVIGNPPYQLKIGPKKTKPIWNLFFKMAVNLIVKDGYLVFVIRWDEHRRAA